MDALFDNTERNARGIPAAPFVEDVGKLIPVPEDFERVFGKFQERLSQYRFMQQSKTATVRQLHTRVPDIRNSLCLCEELAKKDEKEPLQMDFALNDTLYMRAKVDRCAGSKDEPSRVGLWLGADVMLEYPVEEAIQVLKEKLTEAERNLEDAQEDLEFLRENITTMEVNCARLYNWDVEHRRTPAVDKLSIK